MSLKRLGSGLQGVLGQLNGVKKAAEETAKVLDGVRLPQGGGAEGGGSAELRRMEEIRVDIMRKMEALALQGNTKGVEQYRHELEQIEKRMAEMATERVSPDGLGRGSAAVTVEQAAASPMGRHIRNFGASVTVETQKAIEKSEQKVVKEMSAWQLRQEKLLQAISERIITMWSPDGPQGMTIAEVADQLAEMLLTQRRLMRDASTKSSQLVNAERAVQKLFNMIQFWGGDAGRLVTLEEIKRRVFSGTYQPFNINSKTAKPTQSYADFMKSLGIMP